MRRRHPLTPLAILFTLVASCTVPADDARGPADGWMHQVAIVRGIHYGDQPEQTLDVYQQGTWVGEPTFFDRAPDLRPTLLFIHGGGWMVRDQRTESFAFPFLREGWHVVTMTYRLGPGTAPQAVDDALCGLKWVVTHAGEYGFDPQRVVVAGVSAGGHLALTTGILGSRAGHQCSPGNGFRVHAIINWLGITDIAAVERFLAASNPSFGNYARAWIGDSSRVAEISAAYSPVHLLSRDVPPVLTIHGTSDSVVPYDQAVALHRRLDSLGVRNELLPLQGGRHAGFTDAQFQDAFAAMLRFASAR